MSTASHTRRLSEAVVLSTIVLGCGPTIAPAPPTPRAATKVSAPASRTWDAVIETFADNSIPIRTLERVSGFVATEDMTVSRTIGRSFADCGVSLGDTLSPNRVSYNVLVRGDSSASSIKVTARFTSDGAGSHVDCSSNSRWEHTFEEAVAAHAEGRTERIALLSVAEPVAPLAPTIAFTEACSNRDFTQHDRGNVIVVIYAVKNGECAMLTTCSARARSGETSSDAIAACRARAKKEE